MKKTKFLAAAAALCAVLALAACGDEEQSSQAKDTSAATTTTTAQTTQSDIEETTTTTAETTTEETTTTQDTTTTAEETTTTAPETTTAEQTTTTTAAPEKKADTLKCGIWWGSETDADTGAIYDAYYEFREGGSGFVVYQDIGTGVALSYKLSDDNKKINVYMADTESRSTFNITYKDEDNITFKSGKERTITLKYMGNDGIGVFNFYPNTELGEMAQSFYESKKGKRPDYVDAQINKKGMIVLTLISFTDSGDMKTLDVYTVDRFTAKGTDKAGKSIDLTKAAKG